MPDNPDDFFRNAALRRASQPAIVTGSKGGNPLRIVIIIVVLAAIGFGVFKFLQGRSDAPDADIKKLSAMIAAAERTAREDFEVADKIDQSLVDEEATKELPAFRENRRADIARAAALFEKAAAGLRLVAQKAEDFAAGKPGPAVEAFLRAKAESLRTSAQAYDLHRDMANMFGDESIRTKDQLSTKLNETFLDAMALFRTAMEQNSRADDLGREVMK